MVTRVDIDVQQLWHDYRAHPTIELRNQLVEHYLPLVKYNAERIWSRLPEGVDLDDLGIRDGLADFPLPLVDELTGAEDQAAVRPAPCMGVTRRISHERLARPHLADDEDGLLPVERLASRFDDVGLGLERITAQVERRQRIAAGYVKGKGADAFARVFGRSATAAYRLPDR